MNMGRRSAIVIGCLGLVGLLWTKLFARGRDQVRELTIEGNDYAFSPAQIEVQKDDLVKVSFRARDIAHSFTIDDYRIAKRAAAGQTVVFEFRADQPGRFRYYCNLTSDERCRNMKGELVVR